MTTPSAPNRFDARNLFLGTKWNAFMLVIGLIALCICGSFLWDAVSAKDWWAVAGWGLGVVVFGNTAWTSAFRLLRKRKAD